MAALVNGPEGDALEWGSINWPRVEGEVRHLRQRIFTASQAGMSTRPLGLLEPDARMTCMSGSEGARAQQCARATRRLRR